MSFEYNGVVYRDLEPQVRYDAEQVQLLKQADVTINENLQTINTEVNGKLAKPANPSAESAVTMLADGTVGTKLLSEIGGGGGGGYGLNGNGSSAGTNNKAGWAAGGCGGVGNDNAVGTDGGSGICVLTYWAWE